MYLFSQLLDAAVNGPGEHNTLIGVNIFRELVPGVYPAFSFIKNMEELKFHRG